MGPTLINMDTKTTYENPFATGIAFFKIISFVSYHHSKECLDMELYPGIQA